MDLSLSVVAVLLFGVLPPPVKRFTVGRSKRTAKAVERRLNAQGELTRSERRGSGRRTFRQPEPLPKGGDSGQHL